MPQPNGEVQMPQMQEVPSPVVPEPAPGNDAPWPQAGQKARKLVAEEKLEVNVWVLSIRFYSQDRISALLSIHDCIVFLG